jgi:hypothetical protein
MPDPRDHTPEGYTFVRSHYRRLPGTSEKVGCEGCLAVFVIALVVVGIWFIREFWLTLLVISAVCLGVFLIWKWWRR